MNTSIPAFGAGNHNVAFVVGTVAFDPTPRSASSGVWTAFQMESVDGQQPSIVVKAWKELARYVLDHVKAGSQITVKGELELGAHGLAIKASFLELVPSGIRLPKPTRLLATLSGVVTADGKAAAGGSQSAMARLRVLTGKASSFELDLEGTWGQGGERLALVRCGDYCLTQGAIKQRSSPSGEWRPVVETVEVLAAYPYDFEPPQTPPPAPQAPVAQPPKAEPESFRPIQAPASPKEAPPLSVPVREIRVQKQDSGKVVISEECL